jgi:predicted nucleotidyltransferase/DNA-binding XRE family transcriptional regulator
MRQAGPAHQIRHDLLRAHLTTTTTPRSRVAGAVDRLLTRTRPPEDHTSLRQRFSALVTLTAAFLLLPLTSAALVPGTTLTGHTGPVLPGDLGTRTDQRLAWSLLPDRSGDLSTNRYSMADVEGMASPSAATLLREARRRSSLSQVELARRAGVAQSVISAYEAGRRQPALPMLARLIEATGLELRVTVDEPHRGPLSGPVGRIVRQRRRELIAAAQAHGASHVRVFGSIARGEDRPGSDVDLLVDLPPGLGLLGFGRLLDDLERILDGAKVDLVPAADLKPEIRDRVEREALPL